jgi:hypothetical protein
MKKLILVCIDKIGQNSKSNMQKGQNDEILQKFEFLIQKIVIGSIIFKKLE